MATKSKVVSTEMLRARSARKTAAPFSTPTSRMASPPKSWLICAPISATRAAISSRRNNISCLCSLIGAFFHESLCESTRLYCIERRTHVSLHSHRALFHRYLWPLPVVGVRLRLLGAVLQFSPFWHRCRRRRGGRLYHGGRRARGQTMARTGRSDDAFAPAGPGPL